MSKDPRETELRALQASSIFGGLSTDVFTDLLTIASVRRAPARTMIIEKGDACSEVFVVVNGFLKISTTDVHGKRSTIALVGPSEIFGEVSALDGSERPANVEAIEPVQLLVFPRAAFVGLLRRHPAATLQLASSLARRLRELHAKIESRVFLDTCQRLAAQIVHLAERYGEPVPAGTRLPVRLSQRDFGELVDATRESVNRHMRGFVADGLVSVDRDQVTVRDLDALRAIATTSTQG